ncbi:hypothetical protein HOY80DRAFT_1002789 [Tuber brumale]|nr:hypothetical protein HOY80DRAFT_1002789 [Tuber brumale]
MGELEAVCGSVVGWSDAKADGEAKSSAGGESAESIDAKGDRLMEEDEHDLSVTHCWKENVMKELYVRDTHLHGENGKVSHIDQKLRGSSVDKPTTSSENRTNFNTAVKDLELR